MFIVINEGFVCKNCGQKNEKAEKTCRNHCKSCLFSMHVDEESPGDRLSACHGLMEPIKTETNGKKGIIIFHKCQKCGIVSKNKAASDDNMDLIINLTNQ